jgi:hypothetical protein
MNDELEGICKGAVVAHCVYNGNICLECLRENTKGVIDDKRCRAESWNSACET